MQDYTRLRDATQKQWTDFQELESKLVTLGPNLVPNT